MRFRSGGRTRQTLSAATVPLPPAAGAPASPPVASGPYILRRPSPPTACAAPCIRVRAKVRAVAHPVWRERRDGGRAESGIGRPPHGTALSAAKPFRHGRGLTPSGRSCRLPAMPPSFAAVVPDRVPPAGRPAVHAGASGGGGPHRTSARSSRTTMRFRSGGRTRQTLSAATVPLPPAAGAPASPPVASGPYILRRPSPPTACAAPCIRVRAKVRAVAHPVWRERRDGGRAESGIGRPPHGTAAPAAGFTRRAVPLCDPVCANHPAGGSFPNRETSGRRPAARQRGLPAAFVRRQTARSPGRIPVIRRRQCDR